MAGSIKGKTPSMKLNRINFDVSGWSDFVDENFSIIDSVVSQFVQSTGIVGVWKNNTSYSVDDVVIDTTDSSMWACADDHVSPGSGSFASARTLNPDQWVQTFGGASDLAVVDTITPEAYGAKATGEADDYGSVVSAINAAVTQRKPLRLNGDYLINTPIVKILDSTQGLEIVGNGRLICNFGGDDTAILKLKATPLRTVSVVAVENGVTQDYSDGLGVDSNCAKLTLESGHNISEGSFCRLLSDDVTIGNTNTTDYRGEDIYIKKIVDDFAYTTTTLRQSYTTNVRLSQFRTDIRVSVSGVGFYQDLQGILDGANNSYLQLEGLVAPVVAGCQFINVADMGVELVGCIGAYVFRNQFNRSIKDDDHFGIGIRDISCSFTTVFANRYNDVASGYETATVGADPANPFTYGATFSPVIQGNFAYAPAASFITMRPESASAFILDNVSLSGYTGPNSTLGAYYLAGSRHFFSANKHLGSGRGVVLAKDISTEQAGHVVRNFIYDGDDYAIFADPSLSGAKFVVEECRLRTTKASAIRHRGCTLTIRKPFVEQRSSVSGASFVDMQGDATLYGTGWELDYSNIAVDDGNIISYSNSGNLLRIYDTIAMRNGNKDWKSMVHYAGGGSDTISGIIMADADSMPIADEGLSNLPIGSIFRHLVTADQGSENTSGFFSQTLNSGANAVNIGGLMAPVVMARLKALGSGRTVTSLGTGSFYGQKMILYNDHVSTHSWDLIANYSNNIETPADITVSPDAALELVYVYNDVWIVTSVSVSVAGTSPITAHSLLSGLAGDDHTQYHTDARATTWLATKNVADLADIPARGTANQIMAVNSGATALEYVARLSTALKVFEDMLGVTVEFDLTSTQPRFRIKNAGGTVKHEFTENFSVIGGAAAARVGTAILTVVGDMALSGGGIVSDTYASDYTHPALIGVIRLWDDGAGKLRAKSGSDPSSATDGSILW